MLRLDLTSEPRWPDLGQGLRVHVLPCTMRGGRCEASGEIGRNRLGCGKTSSLFLALVDYSPEG